MAARGCPSGSDSRHTNPSDVLRLALFPLDVVSFPGRRHLIEVYEPWAIALTQAWPKFVIQFAQDRSLGVVVRIVDVVLSAGTSHQAYLVEAVERCRVAEVVDSSPGYDVAEVHLLRDYAEGSVLANLRGPHEFETLEKKRRELARALGGFMDRCKANPIWQNIQRQMAPPASRDNAIAMSMEVCNILAIPKLIPAQQLLDLFQSTSTPRRLAEALLLFRKHPPVRQAQRNTSMRNNTTAQLRELQRHGGFKPRQLEFSLASLAARSIGEELEEHVAELHTLSGPALQVVVDFLVACGKMDRDVLRLLPACSQLHRLQLVGTAVSDEWLEEDVAGLFPSLRELHLLVCVRVHGPTVATTLGTMPHLTVLSLDRCKWLDDDCLAPALRQLPHLVELNVSGTRANVATMKAVSECLPRLRRLDVSCLLFDDICAEFVLGPEAAHGGLTYFLASNSKMTCTGLHLVGRQEELEVLDLGFNCKIDDWASVGRLARVSDLDLSLNYTVDDAIFGLLSQGMTQLSYLNLSKTEITDEGVAGLAALTRLQVLDLSRTAVGDGLCAPLASLMLLEALLLPYTNVTDAIAGPLSLLPHLRVLKLTKCLGFGNTGIAELASPTSVVPRTTLESLDVGNAGITNEVVPHLAQLQRLESLQLWETSVTTTAAQAIAQRNRLEIDDQIRCTQGTWIFLSKQRLDLR